MSKAWEPVAKLAKQVNSGEKSAVDLVNKSLKIIEENKQFESVICTLNDTALKRAEKVDQEVKNGKNAGRLAGVPFIAKDNFLVFGSETTAASNILKGFSAPYQSTAIERLEAEGAICVAKANLDAFAHGSSTENSDFFVTKNPHDETRVPGGSSGGSAASVALDMAPFSLGTDTGGSIRLPASFCGVVGYKPTYGLVSRSGVVAMGSSLDVIGPIASSVEDAALVLDCMAGKDELDSTTIDRDKSYHNVEDVDLSKIKFGVVKEYFAEGLNPEVKEVIEEKINALKKLGAVVEEVSMPSLPLGLAVYYVLCPAEVSSNLSRYDGQRFGYSNRKGSDLQSTYNDTRSLGFGDEAKRRIMIGTYVLSSGFYDAYYQKAQLVRTKIINEFNGVFAKYDVLIGPTSPSTAFKIGENTDDPLKMYLTDIMTVGANLAGIPAVSLPAGKVDNLPVGLQLMADSRKDKLLLNISNKMEKNIL